MDPSAALYDPTRLLDIRIELDPADWDKLRFEGRSLPDVFSGCADASFSYSYVKGAVTVDGQRLMDVAIRKKGFLGSLSVVRPSLKLNFGTHAEGRTLLGKKRLTLNNNRQDSTNARQCLAYGLYRKAGIAAPRCSLARVTVNGRALGIYSNVESIKKDFLAREFGDDSGNLYEGAQSDFREGFVESFQIKTNEQSTDRGDLRAVAATLTASDERLEADLEPLLDLEQFYAYWALEVLAGHWDSYSGNLNNFYVYGDPKREKLYFIPWGTDGAFYEEHGLIKVKVPNSVYAWPLLPRRLYGYAPSRAKYRERLSELLRTLWNEEDLLAEVARMQRLTGPVDPGGVAASGLQQLRGFIVGRRAAIQKELDGPAPAWNQPLRAAPKCSSARASISGKFATTYGYLGLPAVRAGQQLNLARDGAPLAFSSLSSAAGESVDAGVAGPAIRMVGQLPNGAAIVVQLRTAPSQFKRGATIPFHGFETFGAVVRIDSPTTSEIIGFVGDGSLTLTEAEAKAGATVSGSFAGTVVSRGLGE